MHFFGDTYLCQVNAEPLRVVKSLAWAAFHLDRTWDSATKGSCWQIVFLNVLFSLKPTCDNNMCFTSRSDSYTTYPGVLFCRVIHWCCEGVCSRGQHADTAPAARHGD